MNLKHFLKQWALKNDHRFLEAGDASKCVPISCVLPPTTSTHLGDLSLWPPRKIFGQLLPPVRESVVFSF